MGFPVGSPRQSERGAGLRCRLLAVKAHPKDAAAVATYDRAEVALPSSPQPYAWDRICQEHRLGRPSAVNVVATLRHHLLWLSSGEGPMPAQTRISSSPRISRTPARRGAWRTAI